jgi:heme exporter protein CcmD
MGYVWAGYGITLATLATYAVWLLRRARRLG